MTWALLLQLCCVLKATYTSTIVSQTPGEVIVRTGGTVTLECKINELNADCYSATWLKVDQKTQKMIQNKNLNVNINSDNKKKLDKCSANITYAILSDSGVYYCLVNFHKMIYIGNGSRVIIVTEKEKPGNSFESSPIKILSTQDSDGSPVPLVCLVSGLVPSQVRVSWLIDGREESGLTGSAWTDNSDSATEFTRNQILVQAEEWNRGAKCTCVVELEGHNITKTVQIRNDFHSKCTVLLYGASAAAILVIIMAVTIAVFLYRSEKNSFSYTGRSGPAKMSDCSSVSYATLDHVRFVRCQNNREEQNTL